MTKIEQFNKAKAVAENIKRMVQKALGRDDPSNDKHLVQVAFTGLSSEGWAPMRFQIHASYGYFGSSSGYSATSKELGEYLAKAIETHAATLLDHAVTLAEQDAGTARKAAEDEARAVLQETTAA